MNARAWLFALGAVVVGCNEPAVVATRPPVADAAAPVTPEREPGAGAPSPDAFVLPDSPPPAPPCGGCGPGQTCREPTCIDDCRSDRAVPCAAPRVCDFITGACVAPQAGCVLTGTAVACGGAEFPPRCGPGSRCAPDQGCLPDGGCRRVVCDASNFCRGADCPQMGGGGVQSVSLDPVPDATAGAAGGVKLRATVKADGLCGLTVTFELRRDLELFVSAYNDKGIWRVPLAGTPTRYVTEAQPIGGVAADRNGTLYYTVQNAGAIRRVAPGGGAMPATEAFATIPAGSFNLARMTFGPDGNLYAVAAKNVFRFAADGTVTQTWTVDGSTFLTGIVFDRDGSLLVAQHWPTVWRLAPGGAAFTAYLDASPAVPANTLVPWNEGMTLGPDGLVYVGIFPSGNLAGVIYRIDPPARVTRLLGLAEMRRDVPQTMFAGVHGVAFGNDGSLFFVNQNTSGATGEAFGQVLARRPSGKIDLVAGGLNFDWPRGYDGDIVVSQPTAASTSAPVDPAGVAQGTLDAPAAPGSYGIRVLVTDPRSGAISEARATVVVR
jgi:sugar lactone lactonase YvrE